MEKIIKLKKTGKKYLTKDVESGHKRGLLCLTCGIFAGGLICESCKELKKCKLCGIVCKIKPTNRIYCYQQDPKSKDYSFEYCRDVDTICKNLNDDNLCESCIDYHKKITNQCHYCSREFDNNFKHYKECGNTCDYCNYIFNLKTKSNFDCFGAGCGICKICLYLEFIENSKSTMVEGGVISRNLLLEEYIRKSYPQVELGF